MATPKAGGWIAGTVAAGLAIVLAAWFLAISPTLNTAAATRNQAETQREQNTATKTRIASLKTQFAKLDTLKAQLADMELQIPTSYDQAEYQRQVATIASAHSVVVMSLNFGLPTAVVGGAGAPAAPTSAPTSTAASDASAATSDAPAAPAAPKSSIPGMYGMTVGIDVVGTYPNVTAFLQDLQTGTKRLLLVNSITGTSLAAGEASAGRPATHPGDLELVASGSVYILTDAAAAAAPAPSPTPTATPTLPAPPAGKNPLVPLG